MITDLQRHNDEYLGRLLGLAASAKDLTKLTDEYFRARLIEIAQEYKMTEPEPVCTSSPMPCQSVYDHKQNKFVLWNEETVYGKKQ